MKHIRFIFLALIAGGIDMLLAAWNFPFPMMSLLFLLIASFIDYRRSGVILRMIVAFFIEIWHGLPLGSVTLPILILGFIAQEANRSLAFNYITHRGSLIGGAILIAVGALVMMPLFFLSYAGIFTLLGQKIAWAVLWQPFKHIEFIGTIFIGTILISILFRFLYFNTYEGIQSYR